VKALKFQSFEEEKKEDFRFYVITLLVAISDDASLYRRRVVEQTNLCKPDHIHRRVLYLNSNHHEVWLDSERLWLTW
jgi:hypothetical protein